MKQWTIVPCIAAVLLASMAVIQAADKPEKADKPAKEKKLRVYAPYHDLDLSDEQAPKVAAIQAEYAAMIDKIREEERTKIFALLTDDQIAALKAKEDEAAKKKAEYYKKAAEKSKAEKGDNADKDKEGGEKN